MRYSRVVEILDAAVGGPTAPAGPHGAFWRGLTRDEFVALPVFGLPLIVVGDGAASNLVKALKGEAPFDGTSFSRMPSGGLPPVPDVDIAFIEQWIDDGCPDDAATAPSSAMTWRPTNAPKARRHDDIWFLDAEVGWAVNSDGKIIHTTDGGDNWQPQYSAPGVYLRCIGFANADIGWVGTLTSNRRLLKTDDGGATWTPQLSLPALAPVAICGMAVINERTVIAAGTNRPTDVPRMMKTNDGGASWSAWDMSEHANILIDTYFEDENHGWVVGGKASVPTPTTRDRLKPVVLETEDGGATWINRLAGQAGQFPFGEWGWKIQFLDENIGFVSLENFHDGAILKTTDGGNSWTRCPINDAQGNANLEGVGFIDPQTGWVGGWGSATFNEGYSSATTDGGLNWTDANEIGLFINRFRFLGQPVSVGYASGDTVYKLSAEPAAQNITEEPDVARSVLPDTHIIGTQGRVSFRMHVPKGTKRLSLQVWDRFGVDIGCVFDEITPQSGLKVFHWDACDCRGLRIEPGQYIVRAAADDMLVSSFLLVQADDSAPDKSAKESFATPTPAKSSNRLFSTSLLHPQPPRLRTLEQLMSVATHDLDWLRNALQIAIQLELATLPPYLTARWTIVDQGHEVAHSIKEVSSEEMLHFGLACNLLVAIGGTPLIADASIVPTYPGPLPGGVRPGLEVRLKRLSRAQANVFMDIEYPQGGPIAEGVAETFDSIGEFYSAVLAAFESENPPLDTSRQLSLAGPIPLTTVNSLDQVRDAIELINLQGEGSSASPYEETGDLAHHYRFGEIYHGRKLIEVAPNQWQYAGEAVAIPAVYDMADIPLGGYQRADVPDMDTWELVRRFDRVYSQMLRRLQAAWSHGDSGQLSASIGEMFQMQQVGRQLIMTPRPSGGGNYGPSFRYVPA